MALKTCIKCGEEKEEEMFRMECVRRRNVCRACENARAVELAQRRKAGEMEKKCPTCLNTKPLRMFPDDDSKVCNRCVARQNEARLAGESIGCLSKSELRRWMERRAYLEKIETLTLPWNRAIAERSIPLKPFFGGAVSHQ